MTPEDARRRSIAVWMLVIGQFAVAYAGFAVATAFVTRNLLPWLIAAGALLLVGVPLWVAGKRRKREFDY